MPIAPTRIRFAMRCPGERNQRCAAHYEYHVHPDPRAKHAALQIAAQSRDDGVNREAMNDYRAQGRCESHKQGISIAMWFGIISPVAGPR
jgi:hypothetical protein